MMNWRSPEVEQICAFLFSQQTIFLLGGYLWYLVITAEIESNLIRRRARLAWAHLPYFCARYSHLMSLFAVTVVSHLPQGIPNCDHADAIRFTAVTNNLAIAGASSNIGFRALILWKENRLVSTVIGLCCIGHYVCAIALGATSVKTQLDPLHSYCSIVNRHSQGTVEGFYIFVIAWDFIILLLTLTGIRRQHLPTGSALRHTILTQGVGHVLVTFLTGVVVAVHMAIDLNQTMRIFFLPSGCTVSVIASSEAVLSLLKIKESAADGSGLTLGGPYFTTHVGLSSFQNSIEFVEDDSTSTITVHSQSGDGDVEYLHLKLDAHNVK